jgi:tetratricopeptide (TPR) repeat protein
MSPKRFFRVLLTVVTAAHLTALAWASDPSGVPRIRTLIPRKVANAKTRSLECVQKTPDFVLWDADKKISPGAVGYVYYLEQSRGNRLLLVDQCQGTRGWADAKTIVPIAQAEAYFSERIKADPNSAFSYLMRGVVRLENEDLDHALGDFDQALKLDPSSAPALMARANLSLWKGQLRQAIADATKAIELNPRNAYAFVERGVFYYDTKEYDKALSDFDAAAERGFKGAVIEIGRGMIELQKGDLKKAQEKFNEALRIDPKHSDAYCGSAAIYMLRGDTKGALKVLDRAIELDPESADSHGNRAVILLSLGQHDKALDDLDDVIRVAPNSVRAHRERAWILATCPSEKLRNGEEAEKSAVKACELTGWNEPHVLIALAAACAEARDFEGAVKWQQKAIELMNDNSPEKREWRKALERYQAKKPLHRLTLLEEIGIPKRRPATPKSDSKVESTRLGDE